jgi:hypothetical protein
MKRNSQFENYLIDKIKTGWLIELRKGERGRE